MRDYIPRKMDLRGKFLVKDEIWHVKFVDKKRLPEDTWGICDPSTNEILILKTLSPTITFDTWLHEILHAIEFSYDLKIPHDLIVKLEEPIREFIKQNLYVKM